jgi:hypothetical protein
MARKLGVRIAIDTDAHEATQFSHMRWGVATARRGWLEPGDVLNADDLNGAVFHAIWHHVVFVHHQFTGAGGPTGTTPGWKRGLQFCLFLDFTNE